MISGWRYHTCLRGGGRPLPPLNVCLLKSPYAAEKKKGGGQGGRRRIKKKKTREEQRTEITTKRNDNYTQQDQAKHNTTFIHLAWHTKPRCWKARCSCQPLLMETKETRGNSMSSCHLHECLWGAFGRHDAHPIAKTKTRQSEKQNKAAGKIGDYFVAQQPLSARMSKADS